MHYANRWAGAAPGAGFAETAEYAGVMKKKPFPPASELTLFHLYDATDYAANLFNVPTIAYSGELDKQKQAADIMEKALGQAKEGRLHILDCMDKDTSSELLGLKPRQELHAFAPRMETLQVKPDRIRDIIGPGGKVIRAIQETTGAKIDVEDSGRVSVFGPDGASVEQAMAMVSELTQEAEIGRIYLAKVKRIADFGAFAEIFPGTDGLIHISHLAAGRVDKVTDVLEEGDEVLAKCIDIDPSGRIRLSRKEALADQAAQDGEDE